MRGHLIDIACSALYDLHLVPKINKIFVSAPLLLSHLTVAFDSDDETLSEFEWDTEESSLRALVESHLFKQFIDAVDGEGLREQVEVFFRRSICDENVLPDTFSKPIFLRGIKNAYCPKFMLVERFFVRGNKERFDCHTSLQQILHKTPSAQRSDCAGYAKKGIHLP